MSQVTLSVVIGTYNRLDLLKQCLDALLGRIKVTNEIIVVDAGSTDGTRQYVQTLKHVNLVRDVGLKGQANSLNQVFRTLKSKYVCWLSDDNVVQSRMLDQAVSILENSPEIGMVSLKVKDVTGPYTSRPYLGAIWKSGILNCNQGMLPTKLLQELDGFDEEFRDYGIDADLTTRVLLAGYKVVFTKRVAIHHYRNHDTDNWTTKSNRDLRLKLAIDLYRKKYATLCMAASTSSTSASSHQPPRFFEKLLKLHKLASHVSGFLGNDAIVARWINAFFHDWRNVLRGRFISKWDPFINLCHPYYLIQQIPDPLRMQARAS